jgi:RNA polymerase sigma-70 factor, ECF subfamily
MGTCPRQIAGEIVSCQASGDVTALLRAWDQGQGAARDELIGLVYRELRQIASRSLASERRDHTLQPTALVHEAYERLADLRTAPFRDRAHFFGVAAGLMRRILVDHARRRRALRRGGQAEKVVLDENQVGGVAGADAVDVIALDVALNELAELDASQARVVELRFFAGLGPGEIAEATGVSRATVHRQWTMARAWLHRNLLRS